MLKLKDDIDSMEGFIKNIDRNADHIMDKFNK